ncbi:MAG: endolytic transglycosylase MltG [Oscillospiraceae bacterium]|jgi:UPF0755 protein|nr:endolytic transglycosylase MltG [Oscillospiraceae bacterium]
MPDKKEKKIEFEQKQRANTGCLRGVLYFLFICGVSLGLAVFGWNCVNDVLALNKPDSDVAVSISEDFTIRELSRELAELGVINQPWLFTLFCNYSKAEEKIEPGDYVISSRLDYNAIVKSFVIIPERGEVTVRVTEGKTLMETLTLIAEQGVSSLDNLVRAADEEEFNFSFLEDLPMEPGRLEGYLYPDTYVFFTDAGARSILLRFLNNFNLKLTRTMRERLEAIDYDLNEILTIASLIQMEAAGAGEMKDISSVIWNRLSSNSMRKLEIDATSVYLIGKENVSSAADVMAGREIDSPYNTFLYEGLPPGPICSPSIDAIRAALYPSTTKYYYYALHVDRTHRFFNTESEFARFIRSSDSASF